MTHAQDSGLRVGGVWPCHTSLIVNRDGLLVCPCERLATCPAGFICSPKRFTSKGRQNAQWPNDSGTSIQAYKSHTWPLPHSFENSLIQVTYSRKFWFCSPSLVGGLKNWQIAALRKMNVMKITVTFECVCFFFSLLPCDKRWDSQGLHVILRSCWCSN